ncbi:uncharacterized mitochondrial protein AtMg00810-like [Arachis stenosperma]|uniref:uncharacterized mitochondrial protein AtMg00810-like n=1 Tax=Arachis stenosperma TaxID=217475 RepID=UPI0025AB734C|nr:uncharacterized mitochondrial protein AtMg00810-like [Arachis stenosperma]
MALTKSWVIRQLNVNNAFLHGELVEEVYIKQHKAEQGSLWVKTSPKRLTYILVYVDDIIITGESEKLVKEAIEQLNAKFVLKDMGSLHYFLGIQVERSKAGDLLLSQQKYIGEILKKAGMAGCTSCHTPLPSTVKFSALGGPQFVNLQLYRSVIGSLKYLAITRPKISYSVNKMAQFVQAPLDVHWQMVKKILRYLSSTRHYGLYLKQENSMQIAVYSDSDWARDPDDRKSTSGYCCHLREAPLMYCDNLSAVLLAANPILHLKSKHFEIDLHFVRGHVNNKNVKISHIPEIVQVADVLTKAVPSEKFLQFKYRLNIVEMESDDQQANQEIRTSSNT